MKHEIILAAQGETLAKYHMDESRNVFIIGPLGSSKTFQTCQKIFKKMCTQEPNKENVRPTRFIAVRNTNRDLETTTSRDWLALFGNLGRFVSGAPPTHKVNFDLDDGTLVYRQMLFMALGRPDAVKKLRGSQATGCWLNEVKELSLSIIDLDSSLTSFSHKPLACVPRTFVTASGRPRAMNITPLSTQLPSSPSKL
ncbi:MAG: hypothetical protein GY815_15325, partial [Gammaproteobacteria bacterium]|nr:hypothetical protein [Gammaproteobacteria bacterium]